MPWPIDAEAREIGGVVKKIFLTCASILLIAVLAAFLLWNSPTNQMMRALKKDNTSKVKALYLEKVQDNGRQEEALEKELTRYLLSLYKDYENDRISYEEAVEKLEACSVLPLLSDIQKQTREDVDRLHNDLEIYDRVLKCLDGGKYEEAVEALTGYSGVESKRLAKMTEIVKEAQDHYIETLRDDVQKMRDSGDYLSMINVIDHAKKLVDREEIKELYASAITFAMEQRVAGVKDMLAQTKIGFSEMIPSMMEIYADYFGGDAPGSEADRAWFQQKYLELYQEERNKYLSSCEETAKETGYETARDEVRKLMRLVEQVRDDFAKMKIASSVEEDLRELQSTYKEYAVMADKEQFEKLLAQIEKAEEEGDFTKAFELLEQAEEEKGEEALAEVRSKTLEDYESYTRKTTLEIAKNGDYVKAFNMVEAALGKLESESLEELAKIYKSYIPVGLEELELFSDKSKGGDWGTSTYSKDAYKEDTYRNSYTHSVSIGTGAVVYLLNFEYERLVGTIACPKGIEADNYRTSATLTILGDGKELQSFEFTPDRKPVKLDLDISKYEKVSLKVSCAGLNIWNDWGYFATLFDVKLMPVPKKLPEA